MSCQHDLPHRWLCRQCGGTGCVIIPAHSMVPGSETREDSCPSCSGSGVAGPPRRETKPRMTWRQIIDFALLAMEKQGRR